MGSYQSADTLFVKCDFKKKEAGCSLEGTWENCAFPLLVVIKFILVVTYSCFLSSSLEKTTQILMCFRNLKSEVTG